MWVKLSKKYEPTKGASKTRLDKKFAKWKLDGVTRDSKDWNNKLKLLRLDLRKSNVHIDNTQMMTHILSKSPEVYNTTVENLDGKLDGDVDTTTIERICDNI